MPKITPFLWYDTQAEEAMHFYTSIFKNSKPRRIGRSPAAPPGSNGVMSVTFEIEGQHFMALNVDQRTSSRRPCRYLWIAKRKKKWTTCGAGSEKAASPAAAAG